MFVHIITRLFGRGPPTKSTAILQLLLIFIKKCKANLYSTSKRASFVKFTNKFLWDINCDKQTLIFYKGLIFFQFFYGLNYKWNKTSPYWHFLQMPQLCSFVSDIVKNFKTDALCLFNLNFICNVKNLNKVEYGLFSHKSIQEKG